LLTIEARFPSKEIRETKKNHTSTIGKSKNKTWAHRDFSLESRPATRSVTAGRQQEVMEERMGQMEQTPNRPRQIE
jgi:hypothetical protein